MKAFEKWKKKTLWPFESNDVHCGTKLGWRAALEEVLVQLETSSSNGSETIQIKQRQQTIDWIKEELGENKQRF